MIIYCLTCPFNEENGCTLSRCVYTVYYSDSTNPYHDKHISYVDSTNIYCPNCGQVVNYFDKYCSVCGTKLPKWSNDG